MSFLTCGERKVPSAAGSDTTQNLVQAVLECLVGLELVCGDQVLQRVSTLPDAFQLCVVQIFQSADRSEVRGVVVGITSDLLDAQFEVSTFPEAEGVDTGRPSSSSPLTAPMIMSWIFLP